MRGRGLKLNKFETVKKAAVALHARAWIETIVGRLPDLNQVVALHARAWIETDFIHAPAQLNPTIYRLAIKAYDYATRHHDISRGNIITIIDYSLPSCKKRLWVINLLNHTILFHTLVAHGKKSGNDFAKYFSNKTGSLESSIGVFETGRSYYGRHGYSLRLYGLEKGVNNNAYERSIVMHKAWYVSKAMVHHLGRLGRSWGCPAVSRKVCKPIIQTIKNGSLLFVYYPDKHWLNTSEFL